MADDVEDRLRSLEKTRIENSVQIVALELVLTNVASVAYAAGGLTAEQIQQIHTSLRDSVGAVTLGKQNAVAADHVQAELADAVESLLTALESKLVQ